MKNAQKMLNTVQFLQKESECVTRSLLPVQYQHSSLEPPEMVLTINRDDHKGEKRVPNKDGYALDGGPGHTPYIEEPSDPKFMSPQYQDTLLSRERQDLLPYTECNAGHVRVSYGLYPFQGNEERLYLLCGVLL